jgi:D-alanyl-D-alanine endopeptidase (penicillin-binding protein 7)
VVDTRTGEIVWAKNADEPRPIASLTKLMTALVFLDDPRPMTDTVTVTTSDVAGAGRSHVRSGNRVSIYDLIRCSMVSSDNAATRVLARSTGLSDAEFVERMNERARKMGLYQTHYVETTGLDPSNQSTAIDQAKLLCAALDNPVLAEISSIQQYSFRISRRVETLNNTNRLLRSRSDIVGGKTGFIRPAGYCLATLIGDETQPHLTTVVLGAPTNASRFSESAKLIDWAKRALSISSNKPKETTVPTETFIGPAGPN